MELSQHSKDGKNSKAITYTKIILLTQTPGKVNLCVIPLASC